METEKIIYIGTNQNIARLFSYNLRKFNFELLPYEDEFEALNDLTIKALYPKVILTELFLSNSTCFEIIHKIKSDFNLSKIPIIIFSTVSMDLYRDEFFLSGASAIMIHPVKLIELIKGIKYLTGMNGE